MNQPWQALTDDDVRTCSLDLARSLWRTRRRSWAIGNDYVETFLAIFHHCATQLPPMVQSNYDDDATHNNAAAILYGRIKHRNRSGLKDVSWDWARKQLLSRYKSETLTKGGN